MASKKEEAEKARSEWEAQKPAEYKSEYQGRIDNTLEKLENREDFRYSAESDAQYRDYARAYQQNAQLAGENAAAQASALGGGYNTSWANTASQQAYQGQMEALANVQAGLRKQALEEYNAEGEELQRYLSDLQQQEQTAQSQYQQELSSWYDQMTYLDNQYQNAKTDETNWWNGVWNTVSVIASVGLKLLAAYFGYV